MLLRLTSAPVVAAAMLLGGCQSAHDEPGPRPAPTAPAAVTGALPDAGDPTRPTGRIALPGERAALEPQVVATFADSMPTGVSVASGGRIFVCFPRWDDP